ncbi:MAG TPA: hypothetical protein VN881_13610 [Candidatus Acidoferrales bacterium]|nr:hypothetical protein [Candidatus Acidoferrales bacterium]
MSCVSLPGINTLEAATVREGPGNVLENVHTEFTVLAKSAIIGNIIGPRIA